MASTTPKDHPIYAIKNLAKVDDSCVAELKSKTGIANVQDFFSLKFDDLKAALPDQSVFKVRMLENIAQYVASGEPVESNKQEESECKRRNNPQ